MGHDTGRILLTVLVLVTAGPVAAASLDVNTILDYPDTSPGDGSCISTVIGMCTLRAAIQEANELTGDDTINVPAGVFVLNQAGINEDDGAMGDLDVQENLSIYGQGPEATIIDGAGIDRVFDVIGGTLELIGLTVTGGRATFAGSFLGGGIRANGDLLSVGNCSLTNNLANQGGAVFGTTATEVSIMDSLIEGNVTEFSGYTNPWGAAIRVEGGLNLEASTVTGNSGPSNVYYAVDVQCYTGTVTVLNSTIAANDAAGLGTYSCDVSVLHSTVFGNASIGLALGSFDNTHARTVTNSIIAENVSSDCGHGPTAVVTFDHSLDSDGSCALAGGAGNLPMTDPILLPLRKWGGPTATMYPKPGASPVVDVASGMACYITDQRGEVRGGDGDGDGVPGCEIGAVEVGDLVFFDGFEDGTIDQW